MYINTFVDLSSMPPKLQKITEPDQKSGTYRNAGNINYSKAFQPQKKNQTQNQTKPKQKKKTQKPTKKPQTNKNPPAMVNTAL